VASPNTVTEGDTTNCVLTPAVHAVVASFAAYPGYTGPLNVAGSMTVSAGGTAQSPGQVIKWDLTGIDTACPMGTGNVCGIHIHIGTSCADAATIGGHYSTPEASAGGDPWVVVRNLIACINPVL
jgi:hypothetical protein